MTKRDEFLANVRTTVAARAAYFCSNPSCRRLTAGPHSDPGKALTTGHAAHIHAAAPGGPRFDPNQTKEQRRAISNAIWLCRECGDIADKDASKYSANELRRWRADHEELIAEVRTKGYAQSLALLQARAVEPHIAKRILNAVEDKRALWELFDAEFPDRVRTSLDRLRGEIVLMRDELPQGSPLDEVLSVMSKTILGFFGKVESLDLSVLRCDANDPKWCCFRDALAALRKSIGFQLWNLGRVYDLKFSQDLQTIMPQVSA